MDPTLSVTSDSISANTKIALLLAVRREIPPWFRQLAGAAGDGCRH
ncbi:MAG TPA: hypothetical protein VH477_16520 [Bryobacteraceae bacterium]